MTASPASRPWVTTASAAVRSTSTTLRTSARPWAPPARHGRLHPRATGPRPAAGMRRQTRTQQTHHLTSRCRCFWRQARFTHVGFVATLDGQAAPNRSPLDLGRTGCLACEPARPAFAAARSWRANLPTACAPRARPPAQSDPSWPKLPGPGPGPVPTTATWDRGLLRLLHQSSSELDLSPGRNDPLGRRTCPARLSPVAGSRRAALPAFGQIGQQPAGRVGRGQHITAAQRASRGGESNHLPAAGVSLSTWRAMPSTDALPSNNARRLWVWRPGRARARAAVGAVRIARGTTSTPTDHGCQGAETERRRIQRPPRTRAGPHGATGDQGSGRGIRRRSHDPPKRVRPPCEPPDATAGDCW